jgi:hypothetical protein
MKSPISTLSPASQNNASRFNEINHLRMHSYRRQYRCDRPVRQPLSHAGFGHFHQTNIQASRPSSGAALRLSIPKK